MNSRSHLIIHPSVAVLITFLFIFCVVSTRTHQQWQFFGFLFLLILTIQITPVSLISYFKRLLVIIPFFTFPALLLLFFTPGETFFSIPVFQIKLNISLEGFEKFVFVVLKAGFSGSAVIVLSLNVKFQDIMSGLSWYRVPRQFLFIISMIYRFSFVLVDEMKRMERSIKMRNFGCSFWRMLKIRAGLTGTLFIRSLSRGERVHNAMLARGFNGQYHEMFLPKMKRRDMDIAAVSFVIVAVLKLWGA